LRDQKSDGVQFKSVVLVHAIPHRNACRASLIRPGGAKPPLADTAATAPRATAESGRGVPDIRISFEY
jgi:hypothetical protein